MDEYLWPARNVAEFAYCPRLFYLMEVEGIHLPNTDTELGMAVHRRVDRPSAAHESDKDEPPDEQRPRSARSLTLTSNKLGLTATLDLAEIEGNIAIPVEYRKGRPRHPYFTPPPDDPGEAEVPPPAAEPWPTDRVQVGLQAILLEEAGYTVPETILDYASEKLRLRVPVDAELRGEALRTLREAQEAAAGSRPLPLINDPKCVRCSLQPFCLPDEVNQQRAITEEPKARSIWPTRDDALHVVAQQEGTRIGVNGLSLKITDKDGRETRKIPADRERPEWPPHPARVFMAMAAAHFETGEDPAERDVLLWLEKLEENPRIYASDSDERSLVTHFVPVNDELNASGSALPMLRRRQARGFPRVRPHDPRVFMTWESASVDPSRLGVLDSLCGKVTRIGHSSSLVRMWATESSEPEPALMRWNPNDNAEFSDQQFRVVSQGAMDELVALARVADQQEYDRLDEQCNKAKGPAKTKLKAQLSDRFNNLRPQPLRPVFRITAGYSPERAGEPAPALSVWDSRLLVFGLDRVESSHARLDIRATLAVARAFRDAAMSLAGQRGEIIDEALSGHKPDGSPSESPHCAFFTLPFVGRKHADGHLMGVAVACPRSLPQTEWRRIAATISAIEKLTPSADLGKWKPISPAEAGDPYNLRARTWCANAAGSTEWATVTPIVFDDHPKSKSTEEYLDEVAAMIRRACERVIDGAAAVSVVPSHVSHFAGTPTAREFPRLRRKDGSERRHLHATITFDRPVAGPIILGAGRYRGYGLLRPTQGDQK